MNCHSMTVLVMLAIATTVGTIRNAVAQEEIKLGGRRIVGGEPTDIQKHPWQLALNIKRPNGTYLCGGPTSRRNGFYLPHIASAAQIPSTSSRPRLELRTTWIKGFGPRSINS
jgi:hypothetical protein